MDDLKFKDIIDLKQIQALMDLFLKATGIPIGIVDTEGIILIRTGWQDICMKFHRVNPATEIRCRESADYIKSHLFEGKYVQYKCKNGLWDIAVPIMVEGKHLATLFIGQFFYDDEKPDVAYFRKQAERFGFDVDKYLDALNRVQIFTHEQIGNIMDYYAEFARLLSEIGYKNLQLSRDITTLKGLLPICSGCKNIRDDKGYWNQIESYFRDHSEVEFSHSICPDCAKKLYPDLDLDFDDG